MLLHLLDIIRLQNHRIDHSKLLVSWYQYSNQRLYQFLQIVLTRKSTIAPWSDAVGGTRINRTSLPLSSYRGVIRR